MSDKCHSGHPLSPALLCGLFFLQSLKALWCFYQDFTACRRVSIPFIIHMYVCSCGLGRWETEAGVKCLFNDSSLTVLLETGSLSEPGVRRGC